MVGRAVHAVSEDFDGQVAIEIRSVYAERVVQHQHLMFGRIAPVQGFHKFSRRWCRCTLVIYSYVATAELSLIITFSHLNRNLAKMEWFSGSL